MNAPTWKTLIALVTGAGCASAFILLSGAAGPTPAEARLNALRQQLEGAEMSASDAQVQVDFWDREQGDQDSAMTRLSTFPAGDAVGPTLLDRAKGLSYRAAYSLQDAKQRLYTCQQKLTQLRMMLTAPPS